MRWRGVFVAIVCALTLGSACTARVPIARSTEGMPADRPVILPSGATLKTAADWTVTAVTDGVTLGDPQKQLQVEIVEITSSAGLDDAIAAAWTRRIPGFNRQELAASDSAGREGWDIFRWSRYRTSPAESRRVSAYAARKGALTVVVLIDGPLAAVQRRSSQLTLIQESLRPVGYVRETYVGRTPRPLDAARVAELKTFIDRMRETADVPGISVALFDQQTMFIEQGFGVRERGRPEAVTPDTLYLIASNTKPLTTLLLANLVDEGRFTWDTPVTRIYSSFKIGDPEVRDARARDHRAGCQVRRRVEHQATTRAHEARAMMTPVTYKRSASAMPRNGALNQ